MQLTIELLSILKEEPVKKITLTNDNGLQVTVLTYGAIIQSIKFHDMECVLGFNSLEGYLDSKDYVGCVVGPVAGRIEKGFVQIKDKIIHLEQNEYPHTLHSGSKGYSHRNFKVNKLYRSDKEVGVGLRLLSSQEQDGFPGNKELWIHYKLDNDGVFKTSYDMWSSEETYVSLTNHSYFNLNINKQHSIQNHDLWIDSEKMLATSNQKIPYDLSNISDNELDFKTKKKIGDMIQLNKDKNNDFFGFDHSYVLNQSDQIKLKLYSLESKVQLSIDTSEPVVLVYTGNALEDPFYTHQGVCLEAQDYPNGMNLPGKPLKTLKANTWKQGWTHYHFSKILND